MTLRARRLLVAPYLNRVNEAKRNTILFKLAYDSPNLWGIRIEERTIRGNQKRRMCRSKSNHEKQKGAKGKLAPLPYKHDGHRPVTLAT
jgi:hypothetical protein